MSVTSNTSNRSDMRQFMSRFRIQDNSLSSFSNPEKEQIIAFQKYAAQKPDGFCSVCLRKLYPEERRYRTIENISSLNCSQWNIDPLTISDRSVIKYMVCEDHVKIVEGDFPVYIYPGKSRTNNKVQKFKSSNCDKL